MSMRLNELKQVIETALKAAEEAGDTTPESRAMIIGAAIEAVFGKRPKEVHHHHAALPPTYYSPKRDHGPPRLRG